MKTPISAQAKPPDIEVIDRGVAGPASRRLTSARLLELTEEAIGAAKAEVSRTTRYWVFAVESSDARLASQYKRDLLRAHRLLDSLFQESSSIKSDLKRK